jgi:hypothetical protein
VICTRVSSTEPAVVTSLAANRLKLDCQRES